MEKTCEYKMADDSSPMIVVDDLVKRYNHDKAPVIDHVNLSVEKGEMVVIMGRSGCGKTTLLNLIAGLDRPTSGSIVVNGISLAGKSEDELARFRLLNIGFVFQDYNLISELTILENVALPLKLAGKKDLEKAHKLLETFDITDLADERANTVSGGEAQRAAIARAIANNPKVLLADEPTGNLDIENETNVMNYFNRTQKNFDTTIVIATHNSRLRLFGNRTIMLNSSPPAPEPE
jgi:putative ABC transport system ATP-binding protein